jgi:hypothetical protein
MIANHEQPEQAAKTIEELRRRHQEYEKQLEELSNKSWLTPEEEIEEKRIKKLKLRLKDEMAKLERTAS